MVGLFFKKIKIIWPGYMKKTFFKDYVGILSSTVFFSFSVMTLGLKESFLLGTKPVSNNKLFIQLRKAFNLAVKVCQNFTVTLIDIITLYIEAKSCKLW